MPKTVIFYKDFPVVISNGFFTPTDKDSCATPPEPTRDNNIIIKQSIQLQNATTEIGIPELHSKNTLPAKVLEIQSKISECYKYNPKRTLDCSLYVNEFKQMAMAL